MATGPRSVFVRTVALGVRFVIPTVPMRVSTPINPNASSPWRTTPTRWRRSQLRCVGAGKGIEL
jgi:hypothetical protein